MHATGLEPVVSFRKQIMSLSLSTTQPYMPCTLTSFMAYLRYCVSVAKALGRFCYSEAAIRVDCLSDKQSFCVFTITSEHIKVAYLLYLMSITL